MPARCFLLLTLLLLAGCGKAAPTGTSSATPAGDSPQPSQTAAFPTAGLQTVEGAGFSVQIPADWTVVSVPNAVAVTSPHDFERGLPGTSITLAMIPVPSPLIPAQMSTNLIEGFRSSGTIESETEVTIDGRPGMRLVKTSTHRVNETSDEVSADRAIHFYVLLEASLLSVQVVGPDEFVKPHTSQIDTIVESVSFK
jgi:hypothetical protein